MIVELNKLKKFKSSMIALCNPDSYLGLNNQVVNLVGYLPDFKNLEINYNFNSYLEGSFTYFKTLSSDSLENDVLLNIFNCIENDRYLFIEDVGFMVISNVDDDSEFSNKKEIQFISCDKELEFCEAPFLSTNETVTGTIDFFLDKWAVCCPMWRVGHVDERIRYNGGITGTTYRTINSNNAQNAYDFLINDIQNAFDCIIDFDYIHREINVYSYDSFQNERHTDIILSKQLCDNLSISGNYDNSYTALEVGGTGDNYTEIRMVNPIGNNIVYNFNSKLNWMLPSLKEKVERWSALVDSSVDEYCNLTPVYYQAQSDFENLYQDYLIVKKKLEEHTLAYNNALNSTTMDVSAKQAMIDNMLAEINIDNNGGYRKFEISRIIVDKVPTTWTDWDSSKFYYYVSEVDNNVSGDSSKQLVWTYIDSYTTWSDSLSKVTPLYVADNVDFDKITYYTFNGTTYTKITKQEWTSKLVANTIDNELYQYFEGLNNYGQLIGTDYTKPTSWQKTDGCTKCLILDAFYNQIYNINGFNRKFSFEQIRMNVEKINKKCSLTNDSDIFGNNDLIQLSNYIKIGKYPDNDIVNTEGMSYLNRVESERQLMNRVVRKLETIRNNALKFSVDVKSFIFDEVFEPFINQIKTGCIIYIEPTEGVLERIYLTSFSVNYEEKTITFTLGNKYNKFDIKSLFDDVLGDISKSTHQINNLQKRVNKLEKNNK